MVEGGADGGVDALPAGRSAYRPDIQALRAIAVAGVVVFHLWPKALPGGFVGVDVFFVISGFLITQQLVDEMSRSHRLSLARFWARRARRILPAALAVLAACAAFVVLLMPRLTWHENLTQIRAAAAYVENWLLGARAVDYLAAENSPSLVQHYWSLSVEEQFYLAWPLLMVAALTVSRRRRTWLRPAVVAVLGMTAIGSFIVSVAWTRADPAMAFFATPTRAWEFATGGLVGVLMRGGTAAGGGRGRALLGWVGLVGVGASMVVITGSDPFPGSIAALPVGAAAVAVAAGASPLRWSSLRVLSPAPVQWLGDNSYAIYLWHWPLLIGLPWVTHGPITTAGRFVVLAACLLLAALTKRFVEDPVRTGRWWRVRQWRVYAFAMSGIAALALVSTAFTAQAARDQHVVTARARAQTQALLSTHKPSCFGAAAMMPINHCRRPYVRPAHLDTAFAATDGPTDPCLQKYDAATPLFCTLGRKVGPTKTIAVVGNSHAWRLLPALDLYGQRHGWKIVVATRVNCLGLVSTPIVSSGGASPNCLSWSRLVLAHLFAMRGLDAVVFPAYRYGDSYLEGLNAPPGAVQAARRAVLATWSSFAARGVRVIVPGDVPGMRPDNDPDCIAQSRAHDDPCAVARSAVVRPSLTASLAAAHPDVATELPLTSYFCDAKKCHGLIGGVVVYFDSHHITTTYSRSLARYLGASIAAVLRG